MSDPGQPAPARPRKSAAAFRTIGEAADELDLPAHVLRFWETKFPQLKPVKRSGGRRYYRPEDIGLLRLIRQWLYQDGYTIRGVQQLLENNAAGSSPPPARIRTSPARSRRRCPTQMPMPSSGPRRRPGRTPRKQVFAGTDAPLAPEPKPAFLDPETRAELEAIRRELQQARALLDAVLRPSKTLIGSTMTSRFGIRRISCKEHTDSGREASHLLANLWRR